jgi:hypothetical protein
MAFGSGPASETRRLLADLRQNATALGAAMAAGDVQAMAHGIDQAYAHVASLAARALPAATMDPRRDLAALAEMGVVAPQSAERIARVAELRGGGPEGIKEAAALLAAEAGPFADAYERWLGGPLPGAAATTDDGALDTPVRMRVTDDLVRSRPSVFFRLLLSIPHLIVYGVFSFVALLLLPVLWILTLIRATPPHGLAEFYGRLIKYGVHVQAYLHLAAQPFPPFLASGEAYPVDVTLPVPGPQNRWSIAFRGILAIPALMLAGALGSGFPSVPVSDRSTTTYVSFAIGVTAAAGFLGWFASLARGRMPHGLRDLLVLALGYTAQAYAYLTFLTDRYPTSDPAIVPNAVVPPHPVTLGVGDDLRRNRLTVFFRLLLAVPHFVWLLLWGIVAFLAALAAWISALVIARVPDPLHRFLAAYVRYEIHVYAFVTLAASPFPGFTGARGTYPVELRIADPQRQGRWRILFRWLLAIPAFIVAAALGTVQQISAILGWFAALFTGRMPEGLRNLIAYTLRYQGQLHGFALLLTPVYPYSGPARPGPLAEEERSTAAEAFG